MSPRLSSTLLRWYRQHGRDLPWRQTRDPYRILVSEIMLQQTQVSRVMIFYKRWLTQFPTWESLAEATNGQVIMVWSGLGYNRRSLVLRDIAKHIIAHGVPSTPEAWEKIKGVGPYTAAAICAFALHQRTLPIDTNIRRVLGRVLFGIPYPTLKMDKKIVQSADFVLPKRGAFYDVPQALFDLATSTCTKVPACASCPLKAICKSAPRFLSGHVRIPKIMIKKAKESRHRNKPYPDRIYRGKILKFVREHPETFLKTIGPMIDPHFDLSLDQAWIKAMIVRLQKEGLIALKHHRLFLPT
ncbi:TPA: A/G-specific adenine glycosylase [Candidatus Uhrbacteria bacterium]|uniref:HhH-GPD family protein n=2 Tax=Candidatus Uhriibacteriota TaxID=1752732 RepID=A0A0G1Q8M9_9BACT|nr:MAG: HhH-GPD family protein [Candidatus Uhrbacteria bacterium GW2011_GWF2_46_218]KKU41411.1 MAG: HhH-GPD family protein [Candidatus Uhrbacteria bacterium GW2011_GWE2_46_68]HBK33847.1 A/G-specific adenine glycosylase [Candidatus Uhrbacteria bacterium]HCB19313.1 A/G-specific adenine glycosylase [Candidatus Uhrbacteria bacterium]